MLLTASDFSYLFAIDDEVGGAAVVTMLEPRTAVQTDVLHNTAAEHTRTAEHRRACPGLTIASGCRSERSVSDFPVAKAPRKVVDAIAELSWKSLEGSTACPRDYCQSCLSKYIDGPDV